MTAVLQVDWLAYQTLIEQVAIAIQQSDWRPQQVLAIARGGLYLGDALSRILQVPLAMMAVQSYGGEAGRDRGAVQIGANIAMTSDRLLSPLLLVDDLVDSGETLQQTIVWLQQTQEVRELRTAVLWQKPSSQFQPDFVAQVLTDNPWIEQPFETYDRWGRRPGHP
ncbi:phosphoribosyltransferase [Synechococcus elongatus]|uniref:phosphoribosyltransferase n=1 Tax=Synechococcus elongatus TaxID=32046 RepID=UPI0030CB86A2